MSAVWHVYDGRDRQGPLSADEVERRYAAGALGDGALVWREGWPDWRAVKSALPLLRSEPPDAPGASSAGGPSARPNKVRAPILATGISLAVVALAVAGMGRLQAMLGNLVDTTNPSTVVQSYQILVWGLAAGLAAAIGALWWLSGRIRRWRPKSMAPGLLRGLLAICGLLAATYIALQLRLTPLVHEIAVNVASQVATVGFQPAGKWVSIDGEIGPHLSEQVTRQLQNHSGAAGILINSPGGLTSEALKVAKLIEQRGLDVRVERRCVSACIGILVSGRRRTAEWNAQIALHAMSIAADRYPTFLKVVLNQSRDDFEGYVARHRMPKAWIDQAEAVGPGQVRPTPPPDLLAAGVLTAVTRDGVALGATEAKWLWVEAAAGEKSGLADVLEAIRVNAPDKVNASGDELYSSVTSGDPNRARVVINEVVAPIIRRAQLSAAAGPTYLYVESNLDELASYSQRGAWSVCVNYVNGRIGTGEGSPELQRREQLALAALIRSAGQAGWRPAETGSDGLAAAREVAAVAAGRLTALGIALNGPLDLRGQCLRSFFVLQAVDRMGPERGAAAWRALLQPAR